MLKWIYCLNDFPCSSLPSFWTSLVPALKCIWMKIVDWEDEYSESTFDFVGKVEYKCCFIFPNLARWVVFTSCVFLIGFKNFRVLYGIHVQSLSKMSPSVCRSRKIFKVWTNRFLFSWCRRYSWHVFSSWDVYTPLQPTCSQVSLTGSIVRNYYLYPCKISSNFTYRFVPRRWSERKRNL